jgi:uncharacterized membrane protein
MDLRQRSALINEARRRLDTTPTDYRTLGLIFAGAMTAVMALLSIAVNLLQGGIADTGGLSGISTRAVLETAISVLQLLGNLAVPFWTFGYVFCMLGAVRGYRMEKQHLFTGFRRLGPVLRLNIYRTLRYVLIAILSIYPSMILFLLSPLGTPVMELLLPYATQSADTAAIISAMDETTLLALSDAMLPIFWIYGALFGLLALPIHYQMRLADYILMDEPGLGALRAVRKSNILMHRNRFAMLRLDLRFWWYYGAQALGLGLCYAPTILSLVGMDVAPIGELLFYAAYLAAEFFLFAFGRSQVEAAVALAYDGLRESLDMKKDG